MQITTLAQDATNSVALFMRILLKILALHLWNQAKLFLDDVRVKKLKTTYNNEEFASKIKQYVVEHTKNLDKVLADLEQTRVIIAGTKSQFCQANIIIVGYIYDTDGHH